MKHLAVIPARKGSVGLPHKNRMFFSTTSDFISSLSWINEVIVTTNDSVIKEKANSRGFRVHNRPESLSGPNISIKAVFENLIDFLKLSSEDIIWWFCLTYLDHDQIHFEEARALIEKKESSSLCSFIKAQSHPFYCWRFNEKNRSLEQYIPNQIFRRQDSPPAWMPNHYVCCFKVYELLNLSEDLINSKTVPFFLDDQTAAKLIDIDTPEDLQRWEQLTNHKVQ
jgi:CMP-N-acetylneuraminic acid synthetase